MVGLTDPTPLSLMDDLPPKGGGGGSELEVEGDESNFDFERRNLRLQRKVVLSKLEEPD